MAITMGTALPCPQGELRDELGEAKRVGMG
jgi:hypothetical protein